MPSSRCSANSAQVEERFGNKNEELYTASFGAQFISGIIQPTMMFLGNLNYVAIAVIGGLQVSSGALTPRRRAGVHPVLATVHPADDPTGVDGQRAAVGHRLGRACLRTARRRRAERGSSRSGGRRRTARAGSSSSTSRSRTTPTNPLISDLSFVADPGQTIAIVGPTGAGKTTLVNLIMRFYELDGGRITLDGIDIADMTRHDLRANVGMVLQDTWLFSGTIRDNIRYGNLDCTEAQFHEAVRATYVDRFVHSLPDGYDTLIDDEGGTVSAGEKQLLTIARAFLADPTILILDEATSSVDTRTEVLIQKAMAALRSRAHQLRDRPPAVDDPRRRPDPGDERRQHRRAGHPRGAAAQAGRVLRSLQRPVRRPGRRRRLTPAAESTVSAQIPGDGGSADACAHDLADVLGREEVDR